MRAFFLFTLLFFTGCVSSLDRLGYISKSNLEKEIVTLRASNAEAVKNKEAELRAALGEVIAGKNSQISKAADSLYGATLVKPYFKEETRPLLIVYARIEESKAALGVGPTLKGMQEEQARLIKELDETLTSIDQLKATNAQKIKENGDLVAKTEEFKSKVAALEKEKNVIENEFNAEIQLKFGALNEANNIIIEKEKENAESRKYIEANKLRISIAAGLLAVACVAGAFFSPIFKDKLALGAALFGAISVGILFVQPWHVAVVFSAALIGGAAWFLRKHFISQKTNENLVNAVQSIKDESGHIYDAYIKPQLVEWNKKYLKSGEKVEDKVIVDHVESILKDYERK